MEQQSEKEIIYLMVDGKVYPIEASKVMAKMFYKNDYRIKDGVNATIYLIRKGKWKI